MASDGEIRSGRKRRELLRRMKRAGREGENSEEVRLRQVLETDVSFHVPQLQHLFVVV